MHFSAIVVTLVALCTALTFGSRIDPQGPALRSLNAALNATLVNPAALGGKVSKLHRFNFIANNFFQKFPPLCNVPGMDPCMVKYVKNGQHHLHDVTYIEGQTCGVNARSCVRVSCVGSSAIVLCNDVSLLSNQILRCAGISFIH
jgi:hypothetical protein